MRKASAEIRAIAERLGVPVVSERLDFRRKKAELTSDDGARRARQLSAFAYADFHMALRSVLGGPACATSGSIRPTPS